MTRLEKLLANARDMLRVLREVVPELLPKRQHYAEDFGGDVVPVQPPRKLVSR